MKEICIDVGCSATEQVIQAAVWAEAGTAVALVATVQFILMWRRHRKRGEVAA